MVIHENLPFLLRFSIFHGYPSNFIGSSIITATIAIFIRLLLNPAPRNPQGRSQSNAWRGGGKMRQNGIFFLPLVAFENFLWGGGANDFASFNQICLVKLEV